MRTFYPVVKKIVSTNISLNLSSQRKKLLTDEIEVTITLVEVSFIKHFPFTLDSTMTSTLPTSKETDVDLKKVHKHCFSTKKKY